MCMYRSYVERSVAAVFGASESRTQGCKSSWTLLAEAHVELVVIYFLMLSHKYMILQLFCKKLYAYVVWCAIIINLLQCS